MSFDLDQLRQALARPLPEPDPRVQKAWADQVVAWTLADSATLREQVIGRTGSREQLEALLREAPPEAGRDFREVLDEFAHSVAPYVFRPNHPRFLAFIPGAPNYPSVLGDWLCAASNFFAGVWLEASGPAQVEILVLDWFKDWLGYPAGASGILTGGGSEANLTALVVARNRLPFAERARAVLYVSDHRHWSIDRAANILGLHPEQVRAVPADAQFRLTAAALRDAVEHDRAAGRRPWCVVANAGATNTGTIDPLRPLAEYCRDAKLWLHVDAAYGGPAVLIPEGVAALDGIGAADSITFDPHKWFGQTFEAGGLLVREGRLLADTFALRPDYMQDVTPEGDEVNFCDHGIALTRRFRALKIWVSVKVLGLKWYRELIERCCRLADYSQARLERAGCFEILCPRQLSIVCFRYVPPHGSHTDAALDELNLAILEKLRATGRAFLSSTRLHGRVAIRLCYINWRTTAADVDEVIDLLARIGSNS